jgi:TolB protein
MLKGKIVFYSDRFCARGEGPGQSPERGCEPALLAMEPDGSNLALVTDPWVYEAASAWESLSPGGNYRSFVYEVSGVPQVFVMSLQDGRIQQLTHANRLSYDPAWSPAGDVIAFVSQATGNDEIFVINGDGSGYRQLTVNTWEWDKHPSWSPDGAQIVFWSNRETGRMQIWIMDADGSDPRNISNNQFNDWAPVWVK